MNDYDYLESEPHFDPADDDGMPDASQFVIECARLNGLCIDLRPKCRGPALDILTVVSTVVELGSSLLLVSHEMRDLARLLANPCAGDADEAADQLKGLVRILAEDISECKGSARTLINISRAISGIQAA